MPLDQRSVRQILASVGHCRDWRARSQDQWPGAPADQHNSVTTQESRESRLDASPATQRWCCTCGTRGPVRTYRRSARLDNNGDRGRRRCDRGRAWCRTRSIARLGHPTCASSRSVAADGRSRDDWCVSARRCSAPIHACSRCCTHGSRSAVRVWHKGRTPRPADPDRSEGNAWSWVPRSCLYLTNVRLKASSVRGKAGCQASRARAASGRRDLNPRAPATLSAAYKAEGILPRR